MKPIMIHTMVYFAVQVYSDKTDFNDQIQFVWVLKFSNNQFKFQNSGKKQIGEPKGSWASDANSIDCR